jgi:hypothetical protein
MDTDGLSCSEFIGFWGIPFVIIAIDIGFLYWGVQKDFSQMTLVVIIFCGVIAIILFWIARLWSRNKTP